MYVYEVTNSVFFPYFENIIEIYIMYTIAAPLIAATSNQKIFFGQLGAASIQERPLIKK